MRLSDFDYHLPKELIAQFPLKRRDDARLLVLNRKKQTLEHRIFKDLTEYFKSSDLLVLNDTRVIPVRLKGLRTSGGKVEVLLINHKQGSTFRAMIRPSRVKLKERIIFNGAKTYAEVSDRNEVTFNLRDLEAVYKLGAMPLPPYIKRESQRSEKIGSI